MLSATMFTGATRTVAVCKQQALIPKAQNLQSNKVSNQLVHEVDYQSNDEADIVKLKDECWPYIHQVIRTFNANRDEEKII